MRTIVATVFLFLAQPAQAYEWTWVTPEIGYDATTLFRFEPSGQVGVLTNIPNAFENTPLHGYALSCDTKQASFEFMPLDNGNQLFFTAPQFNSPAPPFVAAKLAPLFPIVCPLRRSLRTVTMPTDESYPYELDLRLDPPKITSFLSSPH